MSRYNKNKKKSNQIDIKRYSLAKLGNNAVDPLDVCDFWLFALWSKQHGATQDNTLVLREGQRSGFVRIFIRISRCTVLHQSDNTAPKFLSRCCRHRRRSTILRSLCHGVCVCVCVWKLYLIYGMVLCLVTLTDLQTRRAGLSASAELLVLS